MEGSPHVVILPFPAQGHIKPMFILSKLLSQAGLHVTFVNTHHNHTLILNLLDQTSFHNSFPRIRFRSISDGLPPDHPRAGPRLVDLFDSVRSVFKPNFKELMASLSEGDGDWVRPSCIIADGTMSFAVDVAQDLGIRVFTFRTYSATCTWLYFHLHKLFENGDIPFKVGDEDMDRQITCIPGMERILRRRDLPIICSPETEESFIQFILTQISKMKLASGLILNTVEELEAPMISQLRSICPNIYAIGPLQGLLNSRSIDSPPSDSSNGSLRKQDRTCMTWLDCQQSNSVLYISFGSLVVLSRDQLTEFWHGLVNSEKPFLWVIRQDLIWEGNKVGEEGPLELAVGTHKKWCIVNWAPQEEILAHKAVGGFLTHSGWNSTLECISAGVPMICWPQLGDQPVNSRCVSEMWRSGLDMKGPSDRSRIEKMVRDLMEDSEGEIAKSTAKNALMACDSVSVGGSSFRSIEKLIEDIRVISSAFEGGK